jgi:hypothetical protein
MLLDVDDVRDVTRSPASFYALVASRHRPDKGDELVVWELGSNNSGFPVLPGEGVNFHAEPLILRYQDLSSAS